MSRLLSVLLVGLLLSGCSGLKLPKPDGGPFIPERYVAPNQQRIVLYRSGHFDFLGTPYLPLRTPEILIDGTVIGLLPMRSFIDLIIPAGPVSIQVTQEPHHKWPFAPVGGKINAKGGSSTYINMAISREIKDTAILIVPPFFGFNSNSEYTVVLKEATLAQAVADTADLLQISSITPPFMVSPQTPASEGSPASGGVQSTGVTGGADAQLKHLKKLYSDGLITKAEYDAKRQQILDRMN